MKVWIDVGAHRGGRVLENASRQSDIIVYAFEANPLLAAQNIGRYPNYIVVPAAVAAQNGMQILQITDSDTGSTIMPINKENSFRWTGGPLQEISRIPVPAVRLETFMNAAGISSADQLTVDAQGADLEVIKSAGDRIHDIGLVHVEVAVTPYPVYEGAPTKDDILEYMTACGFRLTQVEPASAGQEEYLTFTR